MRLPIGNVRSRRGAEETNSPSPRFINGRNIQDEIDFSCGIVHVAFDGSRLALARYNGPGHEHGDVLYRPHIHRATTKAIASGRKPEREAEETDRYQTLEGALACLLEDFRIAGLRAGHDHPRLPL